MKKIFSIVFLLVLMTGCASNPKPITYHTVDIVQAEIDSSLFETVKEKEDTVTKEQFEKMTLSQRFIYFGEKIINLQTALDNANDQILKIKEVYLQNKKSISGSEVILEGK
jgi:uncharacterized protein YcfL